MSAQPMKIVRCTVAGCKNHTAEGICVPCQQEHGLPAVPYKVPSKPPTTITTPATPLIVPRPPAPKPAPAAPAAPKRPEPQPHNLDAPGVREPLTPLEARVFDVIRKGGFFTPHCHWSEALIAAKVGVSRRTITRVKPCLVAKGWLRWTRVWRPGQRWQSCVYEILAGWHRPHRKTVLKWLDERRSRANVSLNELPHPHVEKEAQRSRGRRVRNGFSRPWGPWEPWNETGPPSKPEQIEIAEDFIRRCGGRERAEAFATWTPA